MGPAPQPPHERAWRHPSELGAASIPLEEPVGGGRALVLATGVAAAMLAAVMVVALTPPRSSAPTAVSVTTLPPLTVQLRGAAVQNTEQTPIARDSDQVRIGQNSMSPNNGVALVGSPNAVSAAPADPDDLDISQRLPEPAERVYILTRSYTYVVEWSLVGRLLAPDGSAVANADGELVAIFADGALRIVVD